MIRVTVELKSDNFDAARDVYSMIFSIVNQQVLESIPKRVVLEMEDEDFYGRAELKAQDFFKIDEKADTEQTDCY